MMKKSTPVTVKASFIDGITRLVRSQGIDVHLDGIETKGCWNAEGDGRTMEINTIRIIGTNNKCVDGLGNIYEYAQDASCVLGYMVKDINFGKEAGVEGWTCTIDGKYTGGGKTIDRSYYMALVIAAANRAWR